MARAFWLSLALVVLPAQAAPRTVALDIKGMDCATCPLTVRLALKKVAGVTDAKVTFDPPVAVVTYDDTMTSTAALTRATADAGYPSVVRAHP